MGFRVFYDKYEQVTLWGKNLYDHLSQVYGERSRYTVMFISRHYARKLWTNHERQSAQERAFREGREYILPVRFDSTKIPGVHDTVGYLGLEKIKPAELAAMIKSKVGPVRRKKFLPEHVDNLYGWLEFNNVPISRHCQDVVDDLFESLSLLTVEERRLVSAIALNTCPTGPAVDGDVHINIDLLARMTALDKRGIRALLSRIECLGFVHELTAHGGTRGKKNILRLRYDPNFVEDNFDGSRTTILWGMLSCVANWQCSTCAATALLDLDFSVLNKLTSQAEQHVASTTSEAKGARRKSSTPKRRGRNWGRRPT
jgi:hypothetical protein